MLSLDFLRQALPHAIFTLAARVSSSTGEEDGEPSLLLEHCAIDSRSQLSDRTLFVALRGEHFDGHDFLEEVAHKGVRAVLVSEASKVSSRHFDLVIEVEDTLLALQQIAASWRAAMPARVIGITGSFGKTMTKELLSAILSQRYTLCRSPGSFNSQTGVPLSLLLIRPTHQLAIIEAGISQPGEMARHAAMIAPDYGILTSTRVAHPAGLPTEAETKREKLLLFKDINNARDLIIAPSSSGEEGEEHQAKILTSSYDPLHGGWRFTMKLSLEDGVETTQPFHLDAPGEHMLELATLCVRMALLLGCTVDEIRRGLASYQAAPMRLEVHTTPDQITLINDAYSADPISARAAVEALIQHGGSQRKIAIFGEMLELGEESVRAHRELGEWIAATGQIDALITVGEDAAHIAQGAMSRGMSSGSIRRCENLEELSTLLTTQSVLRPRDVVLFKASRAIGLERIARLYLESLGPTRLTINLGAIRHNFHTLRQHVAPHIEVLAVVKSFGYGNDATRVSMTLIREGVDALSVAYADEAIALRKAGISALPILVHNTLEEDLEKIARYDLTALLYSRQVASRLQTICAQDGVRREVHIKIDTGMHRLGLRVEELDEFLHHLASTCPLLEVVGLMTHLAAADMEEEDAYTHEQLEAFDRAVEIARGHGLPIRHIHAANTAAAWRFPLRNHTMVRIGLGLYGLDPGPDVTRAHAPIQPALELSTRVISLHRLQPGETIGYGRSYRASEPMLIATIAIGYNDGFSRAMSNGGEVLIGGTRCEVVGRVCMDVCMIDVTHLERRVEEGDEVIIFGTQGDETLSVDEMARRCNTISYEILCNISPRVRRIFVQDQG